MGVYEGSAMVVVLVVVQWGAQINSEDVNWQASRRREQSLSMRGCV